MKITRIAEQAVPVPYSSFRAHGICRGLAPPARPLEFRCFSLSPGNGSAVMMAFSTVPLYIRLYIGEMFLNYPAARGSYIRNSHGAMFKLPVQTRIKKMKIPMQLNYQFTKKNEWCKMSM